MNLFRFCKTSLAGCLVVLLVAATAGYAGELLVDEEFSEWPAFAMAFPSTQSLKGWRLFGSTGSQGSLNLVQEGGRKILRMARLNTSGDCGVDRWDSDKRDLVDPGALVFVRVWGRKTSAAAVLQVSLHEFNRTTYLGIDNSHLFALDDDFDVFHFEVALGSQTNEVSVGLRLQGTGSAEILRIEAGEVKPAWKHIREDFSGWDPLNLQLPGTWEKSGWSLEGTGGAAGTFLLQDTPLEKYLRLTHANPAGSLVVNRVGSGILEKPLVSEDFSGWSSFTQSLPGTAIRNGWRFFGVSGAAGSYQLLSSANGPYVRLTWSNGVGDAAMDRDVSNLRVPVTPGMSIHFKVWARRVSASAGLKASLAEFNASEVYLGQENDHSFSLTNQFTMYEFNVVTSQNTAAVNPAFRVAGTGSIDIARIELTYRDSSAAQLVRISPSKPLDFAISARAANIDTPLILTLQEFDRTDGGVLRSTTQSIDLTADYSDSILSVTPTSTTRWVNPMIVLESSGTVDIRSITLTLKGAPAPVILLPQGWTPNAEPVLYWRSNAHQAVRIQLATDPQFQNITWDSNEVVLGGNHYRLPPMASGDVLFARLRSLDFEGNWSLWSDPTVIQYQPFARCETSSVGLYDLYPVRSMPAMEAHEHLHLVSVLQGLANRAAPNLLVRWMQADDYWRGKLQQPGRFLETAEIVSIPSLEALLERYAGVYQGVVLWDPSVPATSNVASTVAGVDNLLPIPYRDTPGSLYRRLVAAGPQLPVRVNLVGKFTGSGMIPDINESSSGSAKNDAYRWAIERYLETGLCNPARMGYTIDSFWTSHPEYGGDYSNSALTNHDFIIRHKGCFWDLSVWGDEKPNDDPGQPLQTDLTTLKRLFAAAASQSNQQIIHVAGFTPWAWKYCNELYSHGGTSTPFGKHGGVETEWETVRILSSYNAFIDADAIGLVGLSNASFYDHMPRPERFNFSPPPQLEDMQSSGYISAAGEAVPRTYWINYIGDYDSAAWMTTQLPSKWDHFRRNDLIHSWGWGPQLMERGMPIFDEYLRTCTPRDPVWASDNGAGYLNPTQLFTPRNPSGLGSGTATWQNHCRRWFQSLGIRQTGFVIDGGGPNFTHAQQAIYEPFSGDGLVTHTQFRAGEYPHMIGSMPVVGMADGGLNASPQNAASQIANLASSGGRHFLPVRSILKDPGYYYELNRALQRNHASILPALLDPNWFFYLMRHFLGGDNSARAFFLADTIPSEVIQGRTYQASAWLRNIGWDSWDSSEGMGYRLAVNLSDSINFTDSQLIAIGGVLAPGKMAELQFQFEVPSEEGRKYLLMDVVDPSGNRFGEKGNPFLIREVDLIGEPVGVSNWPEY
ncbi:MAG: hypothetical protein IPI28_06345 [Candidatus Omnitrophica bacterium]|nr:hypothetical protein [Candidatus Omnitrophota bacterium]